MTEPLDNEAQPSARSEDPRTLLAEWANKSDEWVRLLVAEVIASGRPVDESLIDTAYELRSIGRFHSAFEHPAERH